MLDYSFFKKYFKRLGKAAILKMLNSLQNVFGLNKEKEKRKSKQIEACENQQAPSFSIVKQENNFLSFAPNTHMSAHSLSLLSLTHTRHTHTRQTHTRHTHTRHTHTYTNTCVYIERRLASTPSLHSCLCVIELDLGENLDTTHWYTYTQTEKQRERKKELLEKTEDKY